MGNNKNKWEEERPVYFLLAFVGLIIAVFFYFTPKDFRKITESDLSTVENLILENDPKLYTIKGKESFRFQIKGYKKTFQISGFDFYPPNKRLITNNLKSGDTITIKLQPSEFKAIDSESFFNSYVEINSLKKNGFEFLNIKSRNNNASNDLASGIPVGIFLLLTGLIYGSLKTRPQLSPKLIIGIGVLFVIILSK